MALTKKEKRDLNILMHQLRVKVEILTKGYSKDHGETLKSIYTGGIDLGTRTKQLQVTNEKRKLKRKFKR